MDYEKIMGYTPQSCCASVTEKLINYGSQSCCASTSKLKGKGNSKLEEIANPLTIKDLIKLKELF